MERRQRRTCTEEFKGQMVGLYDAGKARAEIAREYGLTPSALDRWISRINKTGSTKEKDLPDVREAFGEGKGNYGTRQIKTALSEKGIVMSRRKPTPSLTGTESSGASRGRARRLTTPSRNPSTGR